MRSLPTRSIPLFLLVAASLVVSCSDDDDADPARTSNTVELCSPEQCTDPAPAAPNFECPDGSTAGPACTEGDDSTCGWEILECETDDTSDVVCSPADCPTPAPAAPSYQCDDGTIAGPACQANDAGECGWQIISCPDPMKCTPDSCDGPAPGAPNYLCPDGSIAGPVCDSVDDASCGWIIRECPSVSDS